MKVKKECQAARYWGAGLVGIVTAHKIGNLRLTLFKCGETRAVSYLPPGLSTEFGDLSVEGLAPHVGQSQESLIQAVTQLTSPKCCAIIQTQALDHPRRFTYCG